MKKYNDFSFWAGRMVFRMNAGPDFDEVSGGGAEGGNPYVEVAKGAAKAARQNIDADLTNEGDAPAEYDPLVEAARIRGLAEIPGNSEKMARDFAEKFRTGDFPFNIDIEGARSNAGDDVLHLRPGVTADITDKEGKVVGRIAFNLSVNPKYFPGMILKIAMTKDGSVYDRGNKENLITFDVGEIFTDELYKMMESVKDYQDITAGLDLENFKVQYEKTYRLGEVGGSKISISGVDGAELDFRGEIWMSDDDSDGKNEYHIGGVIRTLTKGNVSDYDDMPSDPDDDIRRISETFRTIPALQARLLELDKLCGSL